MEFKINKKQKQGNRRVLSLVTILLSMPFLAGIHYRCSINELEPDFKVIKSYTLPSVLTETSGLVYFNGLIWSFNDSGGEPELYAWSERDSSIVKRVTLWNGYNFDWEDIAQDGRYIYIGDMGNNFGSRGNLCIYRIEKQKLLKKGNQAVKAERITFTYPGYHPVSYTSFKLSSFDCEAIVVRNDSIFLFSKDWNTARTTVYSIPAAPGDYVAAKICNFDSKGLVTAADYDGKQLVLLGYKDYSAFLWIFKDISGFDLNKQNGKRLELKELGNAQTEGVAIKDDHTLYISCEKCSILQHLWIARIK